jgi:hypothetical protein
MPSFDYSAFLTQAAADARYQALGSLGSSTPTAETADNAGSAGVSTSAARQDHVHPITCDTAVSVTTANGEGSSANFARADHTHTGAALGALANGYAQVTSSLGAATYASDTNLAGLTVTVTTVAGRRYKVTGYVFGTADAVPSAVQLRLKEDGTEKQLCELSFTAVAARNTWVLQAILTPSAGSHTYNLSAVRTNGTANITFQGFSTDPLFILVEDIGT